MDSDIDSLLDSFKPKTKIPKLYPFKNSADAERALQIMKDISDGKIILKPINSTQQEISAMFHYLFVRYERYKNSYPFPTYLTRRIINAYNSAFFSGMIEEADMENEELKKQLLATKKKLAKYEGDDKPTDSVQSEVQEENDKT